MTSNQASAPTTLGAVIHFVPPSRVLGKWHSAMRHHARTGPLLTRSGPRLVFSTVMRGHPPCWPACEPWRGGASSKTCAFVPSSCRTRLPVPSLSHLRRSHPPTMRAQVMAPPSGASHPTAHHPPRVLRWSLSELPIGEPDCAHLHPLQPVSALPARVKRHTRFLAPHPRLANVLLS